MSEIFEVKYDTAPTWDFNGQQIEGIVEYVGAEGVVASKWPLVRMKQPRSGDWVDLRGLYRERGWVGREYYSDYGRIERIDWLEDGDFHVCFNAGSAYLGLTHDDAGNPRGYISISGGPFGLFWQKDLERTYKLRRGRYWNFRNGDARAHNGQDHYIYRPIFVLAADAENVISRD